MKVFKFGGASVKDAKAIKNLTSIVKNFHNEPLVIIISAMGKSTNALEEILNKAYKRKPYHEQLNTLIAYHLSIVQELFIGQQDNPESFIKDLFDIEEELNGNLNKENFNMFYDLIVSKGEIASTRIVEAYLKTQGIKSSWMDARQLVRTDSTFREGKVDWEFSCTKIHQQLQPILKNSIVVTQGFIASDINGYTTTLGREGSDYSAAIFASCLNAEAVVIWKDVDGILNADPKKIEGAVKYDELPYQEAAEMTFYGASVIHPKTIKPLANKKIPLWVRPFDNIAATGTCIHECEVKNLTPAIIFKPNQCLISFRVKDFTFINERSLSLIFHVLDALNIKINVMQNSAISFSICIDNQDYKIAALLERLKNDFDIYYNEHLQLITVKNYIPKVVEEVSGDHLIMLEQRTRNNYQIVVSEVQT